MRQVALWAMRSPDPSSKVGAVIATQDNKFLSSGYNGFPRGMDHPPADSPIWKAPEKYKYFAHAEANAVFNAASEGIRVKGAVMYIMAPSCSGCATAIANSGISKVIYYEPSYELWMDVMRKRNEGWTDSIEDAKKILQSAHVSLIPWSSKQTLNLDTFIDGQHFVV